LSIWCDGEFSDSLFTVIVTRVYNARHNNRDARLFSSADDEVVAGRQMTARGPDDCLRRLLAKNFIEKL
jgi:hypothetical protein